MVSYMTVEQPGPWVSRYHLHSLESPREEVKHICTMHSVRLSNSQNEQYIETTKRGTVSEEILNVQAVEQI